MTKDSNEILKDIAAELTTARREEIDERKLDFMHRHGLLKGALKPIERNERNAAYLDKFRRKREEVESEEQEQFTERELKLKVLEHVEIEMKKRAPGEVFQWTERHKKLYRHLMYYFANDDRCGWALNKGLLLHGTTGVGKTMALKIFQNLIVNEMPNNTKRFKMTTCQNVFEWFKASQHDGIQEYLRGHWCFDDLGQEEPVYIHYGNKINVMEQVLFERDLQRQKEYTNTIITTNLDPAQIDDRYGTRLLDRLSEMCTFVRLDGKSMRK